MNDIFSKISALKKERKTFAVATVVAISGSTPGKPGNRMMVFPDGKSEGTVGGGAIEKKTIADCLDAMKNAGNRVVRYRLTKDLGMKCGGTMDVFVESFAGDGAMLVICGGGHIAQKLGPMAALAGLPYAVIDDRPEFARAESFPSAQNVVCAPFENAFSKITADANTYVVIVTYKHLHDEICLREALKTKARYIGMIGSAKKVAEIFKNLGLTKNARVFAPVGLHLGDGSPGEIAVSILAEILKVKSGGTGESMRSRK